MDLGRRLSSAWSGSIAFVRSDDPPLARPVDRRRAAIAALIPVVTFLGFAAIRVASQPKLNFDEHIFLDVGRHILDTGLPLRAYAQPGDPRLFFDHTPLYVYFVALLTAVGGPTAFIIRSTTLLFGLLTILLVFRIGLEVRGLGSAFVGAMLLAVNPFFVMFSWFVRMEVPMCFFLVLAVYLMIHERLFLAGLAIATAVMLKEIALAFWLVAGVYILVRRGRPGRGRSSRSRAWSHSEPGWSTRTRSDTLGCSPPWAAGSGRRPASRPGTRASMSACGPG